MLNRRAFLASGGSAIACSGSFEKCNPVLGRQLSSSAAIKTLIGTGKVAVDTRALQSAFAAAIKDQSVLALKGRFLVNEPLVRDIIRITGALHLHCYGAVEIAVDRNALPMDNLIYCVTQSPNSSTITGGSLTIKLNNRAACGLTVRHLSAKDGGEINWQARIIILDAFNAVTNKTTDNFGIFIGGRYQKIALNSPKVVGVRRARAIGESKALGIAGYVGTVLVDQPYLSTVAAPPGLWDVDLLALFPAEAPGGPFRRRTGTAIVRNGRFTDSQGRSIKLQGRAILTGNQYERTGKVISMQQSCEVDAQFDEVKESSARYVYRRSSDGRSPLGSSHVLFSIQHLVQDASMQSSISALNIASDVSIPALVTINQHKLTSASQIEVADVVVAATTSLPQGIFERSVVEFDASEIDASQGTTHIDVARVEGSIGAPIVGYTGAIATTNRKLSVSLKSNRNTGRPSRRLHHLSGRRMQSIGTFSDESNSGWVDEK